jgi:hypothetical protein
VVGVGEELGLKVMVVMEEMVLMALTMEVLDHRLWLILVLVGELVAPHLLDIMEGQEQLVALDTFVSFTNYSSKK